MAEQKDKVVLAYSGGLDTSCCIKWLQDEMNLDVIAVVGDVGQEHDGLEKVKEKALRVGALECIVVDMRQMFAQEYLTKALAANAMYENKYPLVSALSRPLISKHLVDAAHKFGDKRKTEIQEIVVFLNNCAQFFHTLFCLFQFQIFHSPAISFCRPPCCFPGRNSAVHRTQQTSGSRLHLHLP